MRISRAFNQSEGVLELKEGLYNVTLKKPYEKEIHGEIVIRFPFTVDGFVGKIKPFYFYLIKSQAYIEELKRERFNYFAMSIRKCFDVILPFEKKYYEHWEGKKGRVLIAKHENGRNGVVFFVKNNNLTEERRKIIENIDFYMYKQQ